MTRQTPFAERLYQTPPAVYRTRDERGDLRRYLEGCGVLLDELYATLRQKLADNFPDRPPDTSEEGPCQDWLLPYFAQLLDARLVSPLADGRRDEISKAMRWRQGKGSLFVLDSVVEGIGQTVAVVQEGARRVATTPRLARPLGSARALGYAQEPPTDNPQAAAKHPDLEAATVDFRCPSRALETTLANAAAQSIEIDGEDRVWRQGSVHGAPCFPDSYEDVSPRTVDIRTPDERVGHHHPARAVAYIPPPAGFFPPDADSVSWNNPLDSASVEVDTTDPERTIVRATQSDKDDFHPPRITGPVSLTPLGADHVWRFEDVVIEGTLTVAAGRLELTRCAVAEIEHASDDAERSGVFAEDCLIGALSNAGGETTLSYCTVLGETETLALNASDCIFFAPIVRGAGSTEPPEEGCLRLSRIIPEQETGALRLSRVTRARVELLEPAFGARSAGVLHQANKPALIAGAEDGGEIGAYHHQHHHAINRAITLKMLDFLPIGLELALVWDQRLLEQPYSLA